MKLLLIVTAAIELGAGLALLVLPSAMVWFLVGVPLGAPAAEMVARVGGAGLVALGIACWIARGDAHSHAVKGLVAAMRFYNMAVVSILVYARSGIGLQGVGLWPAIILHLAMAVWCSVLLLSKPPQIIETAKSIERAKP